MFKKFKGFTLVELIIVISILAILSTIAYISYQNYVKNARDSQRISNLKQVESGLEIYSVNSGKYPEPDGLIKKGNISGVDYIHVGEIGKNIGNYIKLSNIPNDPISGNNYVYGVDTTYKNYQIATVFELREVDNGFLVNTYADDNLLKAKVEGNYKGLLKTGDNKLCNIPSLIITGSGDLTQTGVKFIVNGETNLPYFLNFGKQSNTIDTNTLLKKVTGYNQDLNLTCENYSNVLNKQTLLSSGLDAILGYNTNIIGTALFGNSYELDSSIISNSEIINYDLDFYNLSDNELKSQFINGTNFTSMWTGGITGCNTGSISINTTSFTTNMSNIVLQPNTIYKISNGTYNISGENSGSGKIKLGGNCIGLIGQSSSGVILQSSDSLGESIIDLSNYSNLIFYGLKLKPSVNMNFTIDGYDSGLGYNKSFIDLNLVGNSKIAFMFDNTQNNNFINNKLDNYSEGIFLVNNSPNNFMYNLNITNSSSYGLFFQNGSSNNIINNLNISGNSSQLVFLNSINNTKINNFNLIGGGYFFSSSSNTDNELLNGKISGANGYGVFVNGNNYNFILSNVEIIGNGSLDHSIQIFDSLSGLKLTNINTHNNKGGIFINGCLGAVLSNLTVNNNTKYGMQIYNSKNMSITNYISSGNGNSGF